MFHQIILKSSQVLWFIKYVSYISVLYSVPNATLYHSRGRGSLTSFWCGCSFYVGNVSSLFRFMSHCLHCQNLFHFIIYLKKYQKNKKTWKNVVANTSTKPRLSQGIQPVFSPLLQASVFYRDNNTKKESHCSLNVRCRCMSFISVFRRSTLLLCRVGVTTYDYDVPLWRNHILRIQDRNTTKREEGGRADSWWNPQD